MTSRNRSWVGAVLIGIGADRTVAENQEIT